MGRGLWQQNVDELLHELRELEARMRRDYGWSLELIAELDQRDAPVESGYPSLTELLRDLLRITPREAKRRICHARAVTDTPVVSGGSTPRRRGDSRVTPRSFRLCTGPRPNRWISAVPVTRSAPRCAGRSCCVTAAAHFPAATDRPAGVTLITSGTGPTREPQRCPAWCFSVAITTVWSTIPNGSARWRPGERCSALRGSSARRGHREPMSFIRAEDPADRSLSLSENRSAGPYCDVRTHRIKGCHVLMKLRIWVNTEVLERNPVWVTHAMLLFVAPSSRVLVKGLMTPSHAEYQVP